MLENNILSIHDFSLWMKILHLCGDYDTYHLPQYHFLADEMGEGKPFLFFFHKNGAYAALPFLLRPVSEVRGLENSHYYDITSVYGYPGIVTSVKEDDNNANEFKLLFQSKFKQLCQQLNVVTFFSRANPLLDNTWMFQDMAQLLSLSTTVAIDLSATDQKQLEGMTKGHKYDIRKARRLGVIVEEDESFRHINEFIQIYNKTMARTGAKDSYYFPKNYYINLKKHLGKSIRLYLARFEGKTISASMFFMTNNIIQYHLSGSLEDYFYLNGAKLILDEVRQTGAKEGFSWLHLGGGVGSSEDNLYRFKAGFSKVRKKFEVVRMIMDQEIYSKLCENSCKNLQQMANYRPDTNYFPKYREP